MNEPYCIKPVGVPCTHRTMAGTCAWMGECPNKRGKSQENRLNTEQLLYPGWDRIPEHASSNAPAELALRVVEETQKIGFGPSECIDLVKSLAKLLRIGLLYRGEGARFVLREMPADDRNRPKANPGEIDFIYCRTWYRLSPAEPAPVSYVPPPEPKANEDDFRRDLKNAFGSTLTNTAPDAQILAELRQVLDIKDNRIKNADAQAITNYRRAEAEVRRANDAADYAGRTNIKLYSTEAELGRAYVRIEELQRELRELKKR